MLAGKILQPVAEGRAGAGGVLHQALILDHFQHGHGGGGGDGIAAEGVEIAGLRAEFGDHPGAQDKARDGIAIAHRLAQRDHVGDHAMAGEAPHMAAGAAKAGLHLIGEEEPARSADGGGGGGEEAGRIGEKPVRGEDRIHHQKRGADAVAGQIVDGGLNGGGKGDGGIAEARIRGGDGADMGAKRDARPQRGREFRHGGGDAVIGVRGHDDAGIAGGGAGKAEGEVIRLGPGAGEHHMGKIGREMRQQAFGIGQHAIMQVAGMGGQAGGLRRLGGDDEGMAMPDRGHVVVGVEIGPAFGIMQPDPLPLQQMDRGFIEQPVGRAEQALAALDHGGFDRAERACAGDEGVGHGIAGHGMSF